MEFIVFAVFVETQEGLQNTHSDLTAASNFLLLVGMKQMHFWIRCEKKVKEKTVEKGEYWTITVFNVRNVAIDASGLKSEKKKEFFFLVSLECDPNENWNSHSHIVQCYKNIINFCFYYEHSSSKNSAKRVGFAEFYEHKYILFEFSVASISSFRCKKGERRKTYRKWIYLCKQSICWCASVWVVACEKLCEHFPNKSI